MTELVPDTDHVVLEFVQFRAKIFCPDNKRLLQFLKERTFYNMFLRLSFKGLVPKVRFCNIYRREMFEVHVYFGQRIFLTFIFFRPWSWSSQQTWATHHVNDVLPSRTKRFSSCSSVVVEAEFTTAHLKETSRALFFVDGLLAAFGVN